LAVESVAVGAGKSQIGQPGFSAKRFGKDVVSDEKTGRVIERAAERAFFDAWLRVARVYSFGIIPAKLQ